MSNNVILDKLCDVLSQAYRWFVLCTCVSVFGQHWFGATRYRY